MIYIRPSQTIVFLGDSITSPTYTWYAPLATYIAATIPTVMTSVVSVTRDTRVQAVRTLPTPTIVNSGVAGDTTALVMVAMQARCLVYNPNIVYVMLGANDHSGGVPPATFATNLSSIVTQILTPFPRCQIAIVSPWLKGELWPDGSNAGDVAMDALSVAAQGVANTYGCTWVDVRTPTFAWEAANNASHLSQGLLTVDTTHPTTAGQTFLSGVAQGLCNVRYA